MTKRGMILGKAQLGTQSKTSRNVAKKRTCFECGGDKFPFDHQLYNCGECDRYYIDGDYN